MLFQCGRYCSRHNPVCINNVPRLQTMVKHKRNALSGTKALKRH